MKMLLIVHSYYPFIGGAQLLCKKVAEWFVQQGHSVKIITGNGDSPIYSAFGHETIKAGETNENGVLVNRLEFANHLYPLGTILSKIPYLRRFTVPPLFAILQARYFDMMQREIAKFKPDIVLTVPEVLFPAKCVFRLRDKMHFPLVAIPLLHEVDMGPAPKSVIASLRRAEAVVAMTEHEGKRLAEAYKVPKQKIFVSWLGTYIPTIQSGAQKRKRILFFGRKKMYKGIENLLKAMRIVWEVLPDVELVLAGARTTDHKKMVEMIKSVVRDTSGKVMVMDNVTEDKKNELMASALCLVFPSRMESFGLVVIESWAHGTPVVVIDSPVYKSYVTHMKDAFITDSEMPEDIAKGILFFLRNPDEAVAMGQHGQNKVKSQFTWDKVLKKIEMACHYALSSARGSDKRIA